MANYARPGLKFDSLDEVLSDVDRLRSGPILQAGQWTLPMILDHLAKHMSMHHDPSASKFPRPLRWLARAGIRRMVRKGKYPDVKFPAPKSIRPTPTITMDAAYPSFKEAVENLRALPGPIVSDTPFGPLALDDFLKLHLLHAAHHLAFVEPAAP